MFCERKRREAFYDLHTIPNDCSCMSMTEKLLSLGKYIYGRFYFPFYCSISMRYVKWEAFPAAIKSCNHVFALVSLCKCLTHNIWRGFPSSLPNWIVLDIEIIHLIAMIFVGIFFVGCQPLFNYTLKVFPPLTANFTPRTYSLSLSFLPQKYLYFHLILPKKKRRKIVRGSRHSLAYVCHCQSN